MSEKCEIGLIGLAVMGQNLVRNMARNGFKVAVYNRTSSKTKAFVESVPENGITPGYTLEEFVGLLEKPRRIMLMVQAGKAVDAVIDELLPLLSPGDLIIDGGNSFFKDTIRRTQKVEAAGLMYMGAGVSGGEEGALNGPSIMPGGTQEAWKAIGPIFRTICAKSDGEPCCDYVGADGAGHYVKMTHNGIEYGDMQLICEAYYLMKRLLHLSPDEIADYFRRWNLGELSSYLMEISAHILTVPDPETGAPLVDQILGEAGSKGTGMWTVQEALSLGVPLPTIAQAVFARDLSCRAQVRAAMSRQAAPHELPAPDRDAFAEKIRRALYASKLCSYAQGFELLHQASQHYHWDLDLGGIALLFRGGCIIRAAFLDRLAQAYRACPTLENLLLSSDFASVLTQYQSDWRDVVSTAAQCGVAVPAFSASLSYYDGLCDPAGPLNLLQAQRDCFGAHTFRRIDRNGSFHHNW